MRWIRATIQVLRISLHSIWSTNDSSFNSHSFEIILITRSMMIENCGKCMTPLPPEEWENECTDCGARYSKKNADHLIACWGYLACLHCGKVRKSNEGSFSYVTFSMYAFRCDHLDCEQTERGKELAAILDGDDTEKIKSTLSFRDLFN